MLISFEVLVVIVSLNVMATVVLWQSAARRPEKLKKKFLDALRRNAPIKPKHRPPKTIGDGLFSSLVRDVDRRFFTDFKDFARVVNWWLADKHNSSSWRLQELPETELSLGFREDPDFGRRYEIFHNQVRVGELEVSPSYKYDDEKRVFVQIEIEWARLLSYNDIRGFLCDIVMHTCDRDHNERSDANTAIDRALTSVLWQTHQIGYADLDGTGYGEIELCLTGTPVWYFQRKQCEAYRELDLAA